MKISRRQLSLIIENYLFEERRESEVGDSSGEQADAESEKNKETPKKYGASAKISGNKIKLIVTVGRQKNKSIELELKDPSIDSTAYTRTTVEAAIADAVGIEKTSIPVEYKDKLIALATKKLKSVATKHFNPDAKDGDNKNTPPPTPPSDYKQFQWDKHIRPGGSGWSESNWESFVDKAKGAGKLNGKKAMAAKRVGVNNQNCLATQLILQGRS